jgi:hypothetical protein
VKPFIVNIDWTKWPPPHWKFSLDGWYLTVLGFVCLLSAILLADTSLLFIGMIAFAVSSGLCNVARFVRETNATRDELTKRVAEQAERIRKLETQVATLTAVSTPTHPHAA